MPTREDYSPMKPISLYGSSKLACESIISGYCHMFDMSGVTLRLANIVGPNSSHGVIYDLIMKLVKDPKNLEVLGNGQQNKSYLFVDDCISALKLAAFNIIDSSHEVFDVFNAGSQDTIRVTEIAKIVMDELSLSDVKIRFTGGVKDGRGWSGDVREMLLDSSKLVNYGWKPKYDSSESVVNSARAIIDKLQVVRSKKKSD
jgi:UDP-glucose 4-epimerase